MAKAKKKAGDEYPLDRIGGMLFQGALVVMGNPEVLTTEDNGNSFIPDLVLGFVKKLGKSYADVTYFDKEGQDWTIRVRNPHGQLMIVDPDRLNSRVEEHERLKIVAVEARTA